MIYLGFLKVFATFMWWQKFLFFSDNYYCMVARRLDEIVEAPNQESTRMTRREFIIDWCIVKPLSFYGVITAIGALFGGCSSRKPEENAEFQPQSPSESPFKPGYKIIHPKDIQPIHKDEIPHITDIGSKYLVIIAPGYATCYIRKGNDWVEIPMN